MDRTNFMVKKNEPPVNFVYNNAYNGQRPVHSPVKNGSSIYTHLGQPQYVYNGQKSPSYRAVKPITSNPTFLENNSLKKNSVSIFKNGSKVEAATKPKMFYPGQETNYSSPTKNHSSVNSYNPLHNSNNNWKKKNKIFNNTSPINKNHSLQVQPMSTQNSYNYSNVQNSQPSYHSSQINPKMSNPLKRTFFVSNNNQPPKAQSIYNYSQISPKKAVSVQSVPQDLQMNNKKLTKKEAQIFKQLLDKSGVTLTEGKNRYVMSQTFEKTYGKKIKKQKRGVQMMPPTKAGYEPPDHRINYNLKSSLKKHKNKTSGRIKFRNEVEVYNIESYKIYNVDASQESKAKMRRENMKSCILI